MIFVGIRDFLFILIELIFLTFSVYGFDDEVRNDSVSTTMEYPHNPTLNPIDSELELCNFHGKLDIISQEYLNFTISNNLFESDVLVSGIIYQGE